MLHRSSESLHIIWSMLFVAGALVLSYILTFDRGYFLLWLGEVTQVAAEESIVDLLEQDAVEASFQLTSTSDLFVSEELTQTTQDDEILTLSKSLTPQEDIVSLSEILSSPVTIGQWTQVVFETPDPVDIGDKQFFSVQQLFAEWTSVWWVDWVVQQWTLNLQNTYQRKNNWRFVLPEAVGVEEHVQYILKDEWNTHYVYLGDYSPLVLSTVEENLWTVVAIEDKLSINRRWFFWDRVWMISLPAYEARNKILLIVVFESGDDTWLLQIDRDRFEGAWGKYLRESFAQYYIW